LTGALLSNRSSSMAGLGGAGGLGAAAGAGAGGFSRGGAGGAGSGAGGGATAAGGSGGAGASGVGVKGTAGSLLGIVAFGVGGACGSCSGVSTLGAGSAVVVDESTIVAGDVAPQALAGATRVAHRGAQRVGRRNKRKRQADTGSMSSVAKTAQIITALPSFRIGKPSPRSRIWLPFGAHFSRQNRIARTQLGPSRKSYAIFPKLPIQPGLIDF
jgi:hypothetical protein